MVGASEPEPQGPRLSQHASIARATKVGRACCFDYVEANSNRSSGTPQPPSGRAPNEWALGQESVAHSQVPVFNDPDRGNSVGVFVS
jgi:hypothetical protein